MNQDVLYYNYQHLQTSISMKNSFRTSTLKLMLLKLMLVVLITAGLTSCAAVLNREQPSIAHIHIGHAITGWPLAPNKQGLLVVAELSAISAATTGELMLEAAREGNMERAQKFLIETSNTVDPGFLDESRSEEYGLRKAAAEAITHLKLASDMEDASANVQRTVTNTAIKATDLVDRSDELLAYLDAGSKAQSVDEMEIIAEEIVRSLKAIAGGPEIESGYSLYNFREDIESMVAREDPAYKTVDSYYLFNLVKLPDGQWGFASRSSRGSAGLGY